MKRILSISLCLAVLTLVFAFNGIRAHASEQDTQGDSSRIKKGLKIAPVLLDLQGKNRALVGLGSYIVNSQAECNDCHTCPSYAPGHNPFDGVGDGQFNATNYLAGGVNFGPGPGGEDIVSANLTPDSNGKPAGLDFDEFVELIRTGHDPDEPDEVLQVMPWPIFRNMNKKDLRAIYEYLTSIPPASAGTCAFPGQ